MVSATGVRIVWEDVPQPVRSGVEELLGGTVLHAATQSGGFSPGTADRLVLDDGRRAFVKAVHAGLNAHSVELHRREAGIAAALPAAAPVPRLLGTYDDGDWVALVFEDIEGRHPATPWRADDAAACLTMLDTLARTATPVPIVGLPAAPDELRESFAGWQRLQVDPDRSLPVVAAEHLLELAALAEAGTDALAGDTLLHNDVRADNLLIQPDGSVMLVDWPHASRGCDWFDALCLLVNVELYGGHDVEAMLSGSPQLSRVPAGAINGVLSGLAAYFYDSARKPPPPGLPTVRRFQRAQADVVVGWLGRRLGW